MMCPECGLAFDSELDDVACDGCHQFFHRKCLTYRLLEVEWDDLMQAYAFCKECNDD